MRWKAASIAAPRHRYAHTHRLYPQLFTTKRLRLERGSCLGTGRVSRYVCRTCPISGADQSSPPLARVLRAHRVNTASNPEYVSFKKRGNGGGGKAGHGFGNTPCLVISAVVHDVEVYAYLG